MNGEKGYERWFEKDPQLLKEQTDILNCAGFELDKDILGREGRIQFAGRSKIEPDRHLLVKFPQAFPSSAPKIFDALPSKLLLRHHRVDTRQLCLFGFNENRWSATQSVADALVEAEDLISNFKDGNTAQESQPPEPITRAIGYVTEAAILVPPPISTFNSFEHLTFPTGKFRGKFVHEGDQKQGTRGRGIILEASFGDNRSNCSHPFSNYFGNSGKEIHGDWFYLQNPPTQETLHDVLRKCFQQTKASKKADFYWLGLIFNEEAGADRRSRLTWLIARAKADGQFHLLRTFPYTQQERYVRIPGLEGLEEKRVVLIGCGSLGSKIAAHLAASGLNRFNLVDCDYYEPNNSVRHELGVECFGLDKEKALLNRLGSLNPAVFGNSKFLTFQVASVATFAHEQRFYNVVRDSDLIIDTTAIHSVSHFLNRLSCELGIPALFASVTNGAWSGEIVRAIPGKTPCWTCWLDQYYDNKPPSDPAAAAEVFAPGCDQPTFTGTTYDLGIVASLATSMAVETLLPQIGHADFSTNYIRWSGKDPNGKPIYLTEMFSTNRRPDCCYCGS
jgi:molybdopterin/thiamine biosynthesis adenylyltransferase